MPGRITDEERARRLFDIERLEQDGKSSSQISEELGLSLPVVQRSQKYLENLKKADITPEILAEKRSELYLEYTEIADKARKQFELYELPFTCKMCNGTGKVVVEIKKKVKEIPCKDCKGQGALHRPKDANRFLTTWADIIEKKAKLFGLDSVKSDVIQFNQFNSNQYIPDRKISGTARKHADKLAQTLKDDHEKRVAEDAED